MPNTQGSIADLVSQSLAELDILLLELRFDLERLAQLQPLQRVETERRLAQAADRHTAARDGLVKLAETLSRDAPTYQDRGEFELHLAAFGQEWTERQKEAPLRQQLLALLQTLREGMLTYLAAFRDHYELVRAAAVAELDDAIRQRPLPALPQPPSNEIRSGSAWLLWIWGMSATERNRLLDELYSRLPKLVSFVEEVKLEKFEMPTPRPAPSGTGSVGPGAASSPATTALDVSTASSIVPTDSGPAIKQWTTSASVSETDASVGTGGKVGTEPVPTEQQEFTKSPRSRRTLAGLSPVSATTPVPGVLRVLHRTVEKEPNSSGNAPSLSDVPTPQSVEGHAEPGGTASASVDVLTQSVAPLMAPDARLPKQRDEVSTAEPSSSKSVLPSSLPELAIDPAAGTAAPSAPPAERFSLLPLPSELASLSSFTARYWLGATGEVEVLPWISDRDSFVAKLHHKLWESLFQDQYPEAYLLAQALVQLDADQVLRPEDIRSLHSLLVCPSSLAGGTDPGRLERIRSTVGLPSRTSSGQISLRIWLGLEVLRPARIAHLSVREAEEALRLAEFDNLPLQRTLSVLLKLVAEGVDVLDLLRQKFQPQPSRSPEQVELELRQRRHDLQEQFRRKYSAAGGSLKTKHAILVWDDWVRELKPMASELFPVERGGVQAVDFQRVAEDVARLSVAATQFTEQRSVLFEDRKRFDREASQLLQAAEQIAELAACLSRLSAAKPSDALQSRLPTADLTTLRGLKLHREDELVRRLLLRALDADGSSIGDLPAPHDVGSAAFAQHPRYREFEPGDVVRSAAVCVLGVGWQKKQPRSEELLRELTATTLPRLHELCQALDGAALMALRQQLKARTQEIAEILGAASSNDTRPVPCIDHLRMVAPWIERLISLGSRALEQSIPLPRERAEPAPELRELILREEAEKHFVRPKDSLARLVLEVPRHTSAALSDLLAAWQQGTNGSVTKLDRALRTRFCAWVFDGREQQRGTLFKVGHSEHREYLILCADIRRWLRLQLVKTSFVPQLADHQALVVLTPAVPVISTNLVQSIFSQAAEHKGRLVVVLLPGLSRDRRSEILSQTARRDISLAVVDDVDLLRLANPGGSRPSGVVGLLEIVLEQQDLRRVAPFAIPDGQHIHTEMFVGRRDYARELAQTARYSRIFSGRKLGKSALLRFVTDTYDQQSLPSGLTLRVLYVSAVGARHEHDIVARIERQLGDSLGFTPDFGHGRPAKPADILTETLAQYRQKFPQHSLLIFLDEADVFFEEQLRQYAHKREDSLSFRMRSQISQEADSQGLPRVRFVAAGYRVTDRSQGAWANWGQVLQLGPLSASEAAELIGGPLMRLGIDGRKQMDEIAFRCGYQPSILLTFGQQLLLRLDRKQPLTQELVSQIFDLPVIQEEIAGVAWRNFEGSARSGAVFAALCQELQAIPPYPGLTDAVAKLHRRLHEHSPDMLWLGPDERQQQEELKRILDGLIARELLVHHQFNGTYRLRFPHHLSAICGQPAELEKRLKDSIGAAQSESQHDEVFGFLSPKRAELLLKTVQVPDDLLACAVVGWHWPEALGDRAGGVVSQLGLFGKEVLRADKLDWRFAAQLVEGPLLALVGAHPDDAKQLLARRPKNLPPALLCGGADLLRWALQHEQHGESLIELVGMGRLSEPQLDFWFRRRRGIEFNDPGAVQRLYQESSGIPLLVRQLDLLLCPPEQAQLPGTVTNERLSKVCEELQRNLPQLAQDLRSGARAIQLTVRERQVLRMLVCFTRHLQYQDFTFADLLDWYPVIEKDFPVPPPTEDDRDSVQLLQILGLVPDLTGSGSHTSTLRTLIAKDDALLALLSALAD